MKYLKYKEDKCLRNYKPTKQRITARVQLSFDTYINQDTLLAYNQNQSIQTTKLINEILKGF